MHRLDAVRLFLLATALGLASVTGAAGAAPKIELTAIPPYSSLLDLSGRVLNVDYANSRVAVYIYAGGWWTKPTFATPATTVQSDGSWTCDITTGGGDAYATKIAAFLIPASYTPPQAGGLAELPAELYANALDKIIVTRPFTRRIQFSGFDWSIKDSGGSVVGPGPNYFSDNAANVWVDTAGRLHLKIVKRDGLWTCAEIVSVQSFGYGTYRVFLDTSADAIDPNAILGLFTWNDDSPFAHREIDVELARWSVAGDTNNGQYVVQPWDLAGHLLRFRVPPEQTSSTHSFTWASNQVSFVSHAGQYARPPATNTVLAGWHYPTNGVPEAGGENFRMNLWLNAGAAPSDAADEEVVVRRFVFEPLSGPAPVLINCGGKPVEAWEKDRGCSDGSIARTTTAIAKAKFAPQGVYKSCRTAPKLTYRFPELPNGNYQVRLHFAELSATRAGERTFKVKIEGITAAANLDVFDRAGGRNRALRLMFNVTVSDGNGLQIQAIGLGGSNALINGIEIIPVL